MFRYKALPLAVKPKRQAWRHHFEHLLGNKFSWFILSSVDEIFKCIFSLIYKHFICPKVVCHYEIYLFLEIYVINKSSKLSNT